MDGETTLPAGFSDFAETLAKKPPRKPRPSELAKKAAKAQNKSKTKAAAKRKPSKPAKNKTKPTKAKKAPAKKAKAAKKPVAKSKAPKKAAKRPLVRTCRMDVRLTSAAKAKLVAVAKKRRRTITSLLQEWVEKLK